jgi:2,4-dienoyl-CoA reductase-like NADH-dependent reductase (Old Yellow Enzyme family)/thioredoxin reductase
VKNSVRMAATHASLLSPGSIGRMQLRNRMVVAAMGVSLAEEDGTCGDRLIAYHTEQAKGGVALIVMGVTGVAWPVGAVMPNQCAISEDRFLPGLRRLTDAVHEHGAKIAAQLHHGGLVAAYAAQWGHPLWAPAIPGPFKGDFAEAFLPEEMAAFAGTAVPAVKVLTVEDIEVVIGQFAEAAARAQRAGFDGVEIHAAHGYLLSSFLSPVTNQRTDGYGGTLQNRARLTLEVVAAVRKAVGPDFPVWCKLDSREVGKEHGIRLGDACRAAVLLEKAGVDAIAVSAYHDVGQGKLHSESNIPHQPEFNIPAAEAIKAGVRVPIIASGRIGPDSAAAKIAAGAFDFLALGRKILADPDLPRKLAQRQVDDIRPCIYCYTCVSAAYVREQIRCAVNPETGYEHLRQPRQPVASQRVIIVGGGPAGMEAARRLAAVGHEVILLEKGDALGGTLRFAAIAYAANEPLLSWLCGQILRSDVDVRLKTQATVELLQSLRPDIVIVATGAVREAPPIPGVGLDHVFTGDELRALMLGESSEILRRKSGFATRVAAQLGAATGVSANLDFIRNATRRWMPFGKRIVLIGGELVGLELAEFLCERGRAVEVVEEGLQMGRGLTLVRRMRLLPELREHGVVLHANARDICISPDAVTFTDREGASRSVPADHVIVAKGARGDSTLAEQIRSAGCRVRVIGDAGGVGYIEGAMRSAAQVAAAIMGSDELAGRSRGSPG